MNQMLTEGNFTEAQQQIVAQHIGYRLGYRLGSVLGLICCCKLQGCRSTMMCICHARLHHHDLILEPSQRSHWIQLPLWPSKVPSQSPVPPSLS